MPYGVAYTIKMSKNGPREIEGYFDFVVPPLEGFWWQDHTDGGIDYARKDDFNLISCIRLARPRHPAHGGDRELRRA